MTSGENYDLSILGVFSSFEKAKEQAGEDIYEFNLDELNSQPKIYPNYANCHHDWHVFHNPTDPKVHWVKCERCGLERMEEV